MQNEKVSKDTKEESNTQSVKIHKFRQNALKYLKTYPKVHPEKKVMKF